jgi:tRNA(Ile)-lysidine synthase
LSALLQQVRRTIRRHNLCPPGGRLLIAVSGGSDSVALVFILRELETNAAFTVAGLAHVNHRLRPTADRDEQFCRALAARLELPIAVSHIDVADYAAAEHLSIEDAARRARYAFLHRCAADLEAGPIAVGHTRDDQAETFLLKLIRGAGLTGLGGIYPRKGALIRPLLDVSRADLRGYLTGRGESWMEDETNADLTNPRNRVRHRVIPELDASYGGVVSGSIARAASLAREDGTWLDDLAGRRYAELARADADGVTLSAAELRAEPEPIRRRILLKALREVADMREVALEHVEAAADILSGTSAGADLPAARLELRRGKLVLLRKR